MPRSVATVKGMLADKPKQPARKLRSLGRQARVGAKGQVVIPAEIRRLLGIEPGQRVRLEVADGELMIVSIPTDLVGQLLGSLAGPGPSALDMLRQEHKDELEREDAEVQRCNQE